MAYGAHNAVTMRRVEEAPATALKRWKLEDGPTPTAGYVIAISPERGTDANGKPL